MLFFRFLTRWIAILSILISTLCYGITVLWQMTLISLPIFFLAHFFEHFSWFRVHRMVTLTYGKQAKIRNSHHRILCKILWWSFWIYIESFIMYHVRSKKRTFALFIWVAMHVVYSQWIPYSKERITRACTAREMYRASIAQRR